MNGRMVCDPARVEEIDRMLFDAGVMALSATTKADREAVDSKILDARIALAQLGGSRP